MKTALVSFDNFKKQTDKYVGEIKSAFGDCGITVDASLSLPLFEEFNFKRELNYFKNAFDTLVIVDDEELTFNLKDEIAEVFECELIEDETAKKYLKDYEKSSGKSYPSELALFPEEAVLLPNPTGLYQGFLLETEGLNLIVLPPVTEGALSVLENYVLPYLETKLDINFYSKTIKLFGAKFSELEDAVMEINESVKGAKVSYNEKYGDVTLKITSTTSEEEVAAAQIIIDERLNDYEYSAHGESLSETLYDLLIKNKMVISVAESFTSGRVASEIVKTPGASKVFNEGIVAYSNEAKMQRLFVSEETLKFHGAVSRETAYEMVSGLLRVPETDIAVATTGIAGPNKDGTDKPVGLNYIAVGTVGGIRVERFMFNGDREEITERAKNTALFMAIQTLKNL